MTYQIMLLFIHQRYLFTLEKLHVGHISLSLLTNQLRAVGAYAVPRHSSPGEKGWFRSELGVKR